MTMRSAMRLSCVIAALLGASTAMAQTDTSGSTTTDADVDAGTSSSGSLPETTDAGDGASSGSAGTGSAGTGSTGTGSTSTGSSSTSTPSTSTGSAGTGGAATTTTTTSTWSSPPPSHVATHTASTTGAGTSATGATATTAATTPAPREREEGDGRDVDFIWIEAFGGIANVNLVAFSGSASMTDPMTGTTVFNEVNGTGPMFGGALGFRVYWLAVGARTTFASYDVFQIGTVGGEVALRFPIPVVEPYVRAGFGYAWQGNANYTVTSGGVTTNPATTVYGWAFNAAVGLDIFLANWFTIGAGIGLDVLNMTRQTDPRMPCMGLTDFCPGRGGDAVGYQLSGFGQIGFHI